MICRHCGGPVEWLGPLTDLRGTKCTRCGALDAQEEVAEAERLPMDDAPRDGTAILGHYPDGTVDRLRWEEERYCMIGAPMGSRGPGWVSLDAGNLPVDDPAEWSPDLEAAA